MVWLHASMRLPFSCTFGGGVLLKVKLHASNRDIHHKLHDMCCQGMRLAKASEARRPLTQRICMRLQSIIKYGVLGMAQHPQMASAKSGGGTEGWHDAWMHCCVKLAAPIGAISPCPFLEPLSSGDSGAHWLLTT